MRRGRVIPALLGALAVAVASSASTAELPGPPEGTERTVAEAGARDVYDLPTERIGPDGEGLRALEGTVRRAAYVLAPGATVAGAIAYWHDAFAAEGYRTLFRCRDRACGGFDFRFAAELLPAPGFTMDTADFAQLSMQASGGRYASVLASRVLGRVRVQVVTVRGASPAVPDSAPLPPLAGDPDETAGLGNDAVGGAPGLAGAALALTLQPTPRALADRLDMEGHAVLEGVAFAPGRGTLADGSAPALDRAAAALAERPGLSLAVVGHTDTVGTLQGNLRLSRDRAEAVRRALVARGVAAERLSAEGAAWLAPRASNATAEGRALNRRVELVVR